MSQSHVRSGVLTKEAAVSNVPADHEDTLVPSHRHNGAFRGPRYRCRSCQTCPQAVSGVISFIQMWINRSVDKLAPITLGIYAYTFEKYIIPYLGNVMLSDLEIAGLMWSDIDWVSETIHIKRTRQRRHGKDIIGATKTAESNRVIPVTSSVLQFLREWRLQHQQHTSMRGEPRSDDTYALRHLYGEIPDPNTFTHAFRDAVKALELPRVSFHDLRHTHATWFLESRVDLKIVSDRLGHANISTTGNIHAHVTQRMQREAVSKLDALLNGEN